MSVQMRADANVRWTEALLRKCEPAPGSVQTLEPGPNVEEAWRRVREMYLPWADSWREGQSQADASRAALMRSVDESFASEAPPPPGSLDLDVEAARGAACGALEEGVVVPSGVSKEAPNDDSESQAMQDFWVAHSGLAFAVLALLRTQDHRRHGDRGTFQKLTGLWLATSTDPQVPKRPLAAWRYMRRQLVAAQGGAADDYEAARQAVAAVWPTLSARDKATIAFAFPSEHGWCEEATDEWLRILEGRRGYYFGYQDERVEWLFYALRDPERAKALARGVWVNVSEEMMATLLANLGADAAGPLIALQRQEVLGRQGEFWLRVMTAIESRVVANHFANNLKSRLIARAAGDYFMRCPSLAVPALEAAIRGGSKEAKLFLAAVSPSPAKKTSASSAKSASAKSTFAEPASASSTSASSTPTVNEAELAGVLDVLIAPPWLTSRSKRAAPAPVVLAIEPRALVTRIDWSDAERAAWQKDQYGGLRSFGTSQRDEYIASQFVGEISIGNLFRLTHEAALRLWKTKPSNEWLGFDAHDLRCVLARFDVEALPGVIALVRKRGTTIAALEHVVSNDVAPLMADVAWRLKDARRIAEAWLLRYPKQAATRLVPAAVGEPGPERTAAEQALRFLDARQQGEVVRSVARTYYGQACATALENILSVKAETLPARVPALPPFWAPAVWPRPTLKDGGKALPLSAIEHLGVMLAASPLDAPMSALEQVKAACDPASLGQFAWALFEAWRTAGMPPKHDWAFQALGHLGTDDAARQLDPIIRKWPTGGGFQRATTGLEVLAAIGSDRSLTVLHGISQKVKSRALQQRATQRIQDVAIRRGLTSDQLADRLVPDLDFDDTGTRILDFGGRKFRVGLDARLKPEVRTLTGERLRDLPKPGKNDDQELAAAAVREWKALKKTVTDVVPRQIARLERAMLECRRWPASDFLTYMVDHPLTGHLVRRVIWTARDESSPVRSFRVAEDRTCADPQDAPFTLTPTAQVGLLHPLDVDAGTIAAWTQRLEDYEIIQPFEQLGRRISYATRSELQARSIDRVDKRVVDLGRVLALEGRGWRRAEPMRAGISTEMMKPLDQVNVEVYLSISPGVSAYSRMDEDGQQTLGTMRLVRVDARMGSREPLTLAALDPVSTSELLADLDSLVA